MNIFKSLVLVCGIGSCAGIALLCAGSSSAFAQRSNWTGFYIGGNLGYGWGDARTDVGVNGSNLSFPGLFNTPNNNLGFSGADKASLDGVIGGGQLGYNFQFNPNWVFGVEADLQRADQRASKTISNPFGGVICVAANAGGCVVTLPLVGTATTRYESKIDWFGTVRARVGWTGNDQTLFYATGGLAYGQVSITGDINASATVPILVIPFGPGTNAFSASKTKYGFTVGGGIEGHFAALLPPNWTWKLEYLYLDLGSLKTASPLVLASGGASTSDITGTTTTETRFTDHILRVGLNYRFGPI